jgi:hypothetical protein
LSVANILFCELEVLRSKGLPSKAPKAQQLVIAGLIPDPRHEAPVPGNPSAENDFPINLSLNKDAPVLVFPKCGLLQAIPRIKQKTTKTARFEGQTLTAKNVPRLSKLHA